MTKEEQWIKESIENYIFAYTGKRTKISDADAQHFTASVMSYLNLCTPSLPSNLDEAAAAHLSTVEGKEAWSYGPDHYDGKDVEDSFKAGAEWQKEQMMNEVVDGFVFQPEEYYPKEIIGSYSGDLKDRTKVKIIIISSNE